MTTQRTPRRPAMLDAEQAENIPAHLVAQTLVGIEKDSDQNVQHLRELLESGGVDTVSELWSALPANTLPGTLWRLYLVYQWYLRDPDLVNERFQQGLSALEIGEAAPVERSDKTVSTLMEELAALWEAKTSITGLGHLLDKVADFLHVLASGVSAEWIKDARDELADPVTLRPQALLQTASDLKLSARIAKANRLD